MQRFEFGKNWESYSLVALSQERIIRARTDFRALTQGIDLGQTPLLDIGFGQGLTASIAAELGAQVTAIDIDPNCKTAYLETRKQFGDIRDPEVIIGSILDGELMRNLADRGPFPVVHSWGVLHHTGSMWPAIANAASLVAPGGHFILAIYARHWTAPIWKIIKWTYVHLPRFLQRLMIALFRPIMRMRTKQLGPESEAYRGMEFEHDLVDWIGGYPYEYASAAEIDAFLSQRGFERKLFIPTQGMTGCHEYVYKKTA